MGNKWSQSEDLLDFTKNPLRYIQIKKTTSEYVVSLGKTLALQRRKFANAKNPRFETKCSVELSTTIELIKPAQAMLDEPEALCTAEHVQGVIEMNTEKILALVSLEVADQYIEVIHGRYWGLTARNSIAELIKQHTDLEIERIISCGRNRIWHEMLHMREPKLHQNAVGSAFNRRALFTKPASTIAKYYGETTPVE